MSTSLMFIDWERRPAIISGAWAFAILKPGAGWTSVNFAEVVDSGSVMTEDAFVTMFGTLPALPTCATS